MRIKAHQFVVSFDTRNAAFDDDMAAEIARILRDIARKVESGDYTGGAPVYCTNGHTIGHWEITPRIGSRRD